MSQAINFFAQNQRKLEDREKNDRRSFFVVGILGLSSFIFFAVLLAINFYYQAQSNELKTQIEVINQQLTQKSQQEKSYLTFYNKLTKIQEFVDKRTPGTQALRDTYLHFTTKNIALSNSTYDYYTKNLQITLISNSVFSLSEVFSLAQDQTWRNQYQKVEFVSLNRGSNGVYTLKMNLEL